MIDADTEKFYFRIISAMNSDKPGYRQGMAGMSRDLGPDVPGSENSMQENFGQIWVPFFQFLFYFVCLSLSLSISRYLLSRPTILR